MITFHVEKNLPIETIQYIKTELESLYSIGMSIVKIEWENYIATKEPRPDTIQFEIEDNSHILPF
jgi:hypothetical protein